MDIADGAEFGRLAAAACRRSHAGLRGTRRRKPNPGAPELLRWSEIDDVQALWTVSAARVKAVREHRVMLSAWSREVLIQAKAPAGDSALIFPGRSGSKPLSNTVFLMALRRMGVAITAHGFRTSFHDWAAKATNMPREVAEKALEHAVENRVEAAYRRGDLLAKRSDLMDQWSSFCDAVPER